MRQAERIKFWFQMIFRGLLVLASVFAVISANWINLAVAIITMFLTFLPSIISRKFKIHYPTEFEIVILVFIYASMYLGEIHSFYYKFWWWDLFLHTFSGIIIGTIGFALIYILNQKEESVRLSPVFVAIFSFCFSVSLGTLWEIFEFLMDIIVGSNMQKSGLVDTMWDLIVDTFGATVVSYFGYWYLKKKLSFLKKVRKQLIVNKLNKEF